MLWLCNPNNPTGTVIEKAYLKELITRNPQVCFVIDQSYEFFTVQPLFSPDEAVDFPNVLLLHSMTKRYAVPGLRLLTKACSVVCVLIVCLGLSIS